MRSLAARSIATVTAAAATTVLIAAAGVAVAASTSAGGSSVTSTRTGFTFNGSLDAVSATSATNAWAVGTTGGRTGHALTVHWNGRTWRRVGNPAPAGTTLLSVSATSAANAWAVGTDGTGAVIMHWTGRAWRRVPSPARATSLNSVSATSPGNAWAVGNYFGSARGRSVIEHWNGRAWRRVPVPKIRRGRHETLSLSSVAARTRSDAWIVGAVVDEVRGDSVHGMILHWAGGAWRPASAALARARGGFLGVAATSARSVWIVGCACNVPGQVRAVTGRRTGGAWRRTPLARPYNGYGNAAEIVAAAGKAAWIAGRHCVARCAGSGAVADPLLMRWTGRSWQAVRYPHQAGAMINGMAVTSAKNAWAVGEVPGRSLLRTLILHWNGSAWR